MSYDFNQSSSRDYSQNFWEFCQYRLPCGYCTKLDKDCPKQGNTVTIVNLCNTVPTDMKGEE